MPPLSRAEELLAIQEEARKRQYAFLHAKYGMQMRPAAAAGSTPAPPLASASPSPPSKDIQIHRAVDVIQLDAVHNPLAEVRGTRGKGKGKPTSSPTERQGRWVHTMWEGRSGSVWEEESVRPTTPSMDKGKTDRTTHHLTGPHAEEGEEEETQIDVIHRDAVDVIHRDAVHSALEKEETQIEEETQIDVIHRDAVHVIQRDAVHSALEKDETQIGEETVVDVMGNPIPPHRRLDFYGRRLCRSPSPPPAPVKRYRYGSYIVDGRRLPAGGFQVLNWVSGPGISSSLTPSM